jgi:aminoglycoside 6'-N-acetyltransferase I
MEEILASSSEEVVFAERPEGRLCGFLKAALRSRVDGCDSAPVGYIEGSHVDPDLRHRRVGRALIGAAEAWAHAKCCRQITSDTRMDNTSTMGRKHGSGFGRRFGWFTSPRTGNGV